MCDVLVQHQRVRLIVEAVCQCCHLVNSILIFSASFIGLFMYSSSSADRELFCKFGAYILCSLCCVLKSSLYSSLYSIVGCEIIICVSGQSLCISVYRYVCMCVCEMCCVDENHHY